MSSRPRGRRPATLLLLLWLFLLLAGVCLARGGEGPPQAAVASAHPAATEAGMTLLAAGGNAFDAAVAVSVALAVVEPYSSGLGGGGFWLLHRASDGREVMIDGRERAPLAAHRDLFLDGTGAPVPGLSLNGPLAAGIPGAPAALALLSERYGRLGLPRAFEPAIRLAREGFDTDAVFALLAGLRRESLLASPAAANQFLADHATVPPPGYRLRQPELAQTLEILARDGHGGFYRGPLAERLVAGVRAAGGIWTLEDLASYRAVERDPVVGAYRGFRVVSAAPPSSGGVLLVEMLNMLSAAGPAALAEGNRTHTLVEVMRRAYRDRALYLGDPDQVEMPIARLVHPFYAAGLMRDFDPERASPSRLDDLDCPTARGDPTAPTPSQAPAPLPHPALAAPREGESTTHFSILDREGNWVAATLSINTPFGSGYVPPGTGVLLNNEMDDFSSRPGVPNAYGLVGGEANAIAPGRRMLSSMTPTFLESEGRVAILGTPGGSRIVSMVLQGALAAADGESPAEWVARPRLHHQYLPDIVEHEPGALSPAELEGLAAKGHRPKATERPYGNMQAILWDRAAGRVEAASDPRGIGSARVR